MSSPPPAAPADASSFSQFAANAAPGTPRTRAITDNPALAARTIELLQTLRAFVRLNEADARCVAGYMREVRYGRGEVMFRSGDRQQSNHLLLVLAGEVAVNTSDASGLNEVPIAVLAAGEVLGEMSLLDGAPRSATCTALSDIHAAGLARRGLEMMIDNHPQVAAKLLAGLAQVMAERLRAMGEQLQMYGQINPAARQDLAKARA